MVTGAAGWIQVGCGEGRAGERGRRPRGRAPAPPRGGSARSGSHPGPGPLAPPLFPGACFLAAPKRLECPRRREKEVKRKRRTSASVVPAFSNTHLSHSENAFLFLCKESPLGRELYHEQNFISYYFGKRALIWFLFKCVSKLMVKHESINGRHPKHFKAHKEGFWSLEVDGKKPSGKNTNLKIGI